MDTATATATKLQIHIQSYNNVARYGYKTVGRRRGWGSRPEDESVGSGNRHNNKIKSINKNAHSVLRPKMKPKKII